MTNLVKMSMGLRMFEEVDSVCSMKMSMWNCNIGQALCPLNT